MPVAAVIGIPLILSFLGTFFANLISFFAKFFTKRIAIALAVITALIALTVSFIAAIELLLAGVVAVSPPELSIGIGLLLPSNFSACLGAIISAEVLAWIYRWNIKLVQLKAGLA